MDLRDLITAVANEFRDLPITLNTRLASGIEVPDGLATAVMRALRTVLLHVRVHAGAGAGEVTVHADVEGDTDGWEITVVDDDTVVREGLRARPRSASPVRTRTRLSTRSP
nr:hypothetical protein GCM10020063_069850 [Dactylosporangium thailandense]